MTHSSNCNYTTLKQRGGYDDCSKKDNLFSFSLLNRFFALSLQSELLKNGIMEMNKITREEVLRRYQSTRERKEKRLEEMKEILYKRYVNRTGEEPKYFFAL